MEDIILPETDEIVLTNIEFGAASPNRPRFVVEPKFTWRRRLANSDTYAHRGVPGDPNGWAEESWSNWGSLVRQPGHNVQGWLRASGPGGSEGDRWWTRALAFGPYEDFSGGTGYWCDFKWYVDFRGATSTEPAVRIDLSRNAGEVLAWAEFTRTGFTNPVGWASYRLSLPASNEGHPRMEARCFHRNGIGRVIFAQAVFYQGQ